MEGLKIKSIIIIIKIGAYFLSKMRPDTTFLWLTFKNLWLTFQNNPKNLDLSYKTDLDLWDCLRKVKTCIIAKFHRTYLAICSHSREG